MSQLRGLLEAAFQKRKTLYSVTNALRLVNGLGDGIRGVVVEQYNNHFVVFVFAKDCFGVAHEVCRHLIDAFHPDYLVIKDRSSSDGRTLRSASKDILVAKVPPVTIVTEYGLKFMIDLDDTIQSGLFLDMRQNRQLIKKNAKGNRVLNCFSYTCSFGVFAASGGAAETINVDISKKCLDRGKENYRLNGFVVPGSAFIQKETGEFLNQAQKKGLYFDLIIIDPPSFSRYNNKSFVVKKDLPKVVLSAIRVLAPKGKIFVSSNFSGFTNNAILSMIKAQAAVAKRTISKSQNLGPDRDFLGSGTMKESSLSAVMAYFQ